MNNSIASNVIKIWPFTTHEPGLEPTFQPFCGATSSSCAAKQKKCWLFCNKKLFRRFSMGEVFVSGDLTGKSLWPT